MRNYISTIIKPFAHPIMSAQYNSHFDGAIDLTVYHPIKATSKTI